MFDSVRKHQRLLQFILLLFIFPSFVLFGVSGYTDFFDQETDLVKVNGKPITAQEVDNTAKRQAERVGANSQMAQSLPFRQAVLDELLQQRLLAYAVNQLQLRISDQALSKQLATIPEIKALYKPDGTFDSTRYRQLLANAGMSVEQFEGGPRFELMIQQLVTSAARSELPAPKLANVISALYESERQVQAIQFNAADFTSKVSPTEAELQEYYKANAKLFETPEVIDVEFVVLKADPKEDAKAFGEKADQFANLTYDQSDSLKPAADKLKLDIQSVKGISRGGKAGLPKDHPLGNPKVVQALFGDDALKNKRNIEAIQITPGVFVSARVTELHPAQVMPFNEVASEVRRQVVLRAAEKQASAAAAERFLSAEKDPKNAAGFGAPFWVSRNKPAYLLGSPLDAVMSVDPAKLPVVISITNPGSGTTLYRIDQVRQPPAADAKIRQAQAQQMQVLAAQAEFVGFMSYWRDRANVKVINPLKQASAGSAGG
ncbi:MAG: SurA N-terminal domain-containing protein [Polynucleobacter sp.]|nr:SurA N-terminal domain-containing protein [Polynucleobacter sp.]